jgi:outer membrane protein TolC
MFAPHLAAAQTPPRLPPRPLTLEEVLEVAESRSEAVAAARAGVQRAEAEQARARSGLYPQVSGSLTYERALASEFEGVFDNFPGAGDDVADLPFGRENTWRFNVAVSQNLYSGGRIGALRARAAAGRSAADIGLTSARAQLLLEVTQAYYDAALSDRLVAIAEATLQQSDATVRQVNAAFRAGTQPEFELLRARVTRDTQTPALVRQRAAREIAFMRLKQLLDLPPGYDLRLAAALDSAAPPAVFAARVADVEAFADQTDSLVSVLDDRRPEPPRAPVQEAAAVVSLREAARTAAAAERMPRLSLTSNYGRVGYPANLLPDLGRTNWTIGATLSVPILTGGQLRANEEIARADLEQSRAQLQLTQELAAVDTRTAWAELVAARAAWNVTAGTIEQAQRAHEIAQVRYREGVSTQLELSDARLLLQQAEANRAQAARDLQVARARVALLPDLPLGTSPPSPLRQQVTPAPVVPAPMGPPDTMPAGTAVGGPMPASPSFTGGQQ